MAKVLKTVGQIVAIAGMVTGNPILMAAGNAAMMIGGAIQKKPGAEGQVQGLIVGANNPMPYLMGESYTEGVELYRVGYGGTVSGVENPYAFLPRVLSCCGPINSMGATLVDHQAITLTGSVGSVQPVAAGGWFADYLFLDQRLGARPEATALAVPAGWGTPTNWSAAHKLSGLASVGWSLKWDKNAKRWAGGSIPPLGKLAQGVKVYDPRLDSTYPGGSGSQRLNDESTWAYSANPALHAATYAYGRKMNSVPVFGGRLFDSGSIDFGDVVPWANVCDANGWTVNGVIYEPGDKWNNLKLVCEAGGGVPVLRGGVLGFDFQAPRTSLYTVTRDDLAQAPVSGRLGKGWKERHNTLTPRFRSPAHQWTYQQATAVVVSSFVTADGEEKSDERQWDLVTDKDQVTELAIYDLYQRREAGPFTILCKPHMSIFRPGDSLTLSAELGLHPSGAVLAVVRKWRLDPQSGAVELVLEQETAAKHTAALGATGAVSAAVALASSATLDQTQWANSLRGVNTFYQAGSIVPTPTKDWAFTTALPTGFTMTRTGSATRVNSSGYIEDVAANNPRFDHDPVSLAAKGLLLEAARTNILPYSEDAATCYIAEAAAFSSNGQTSPKNAVTGDTITASASNARHIGYSSFTGTAATYAYSEFFKQGTARYVQLQLVAGTVRYGVILDTQTGTVTDTNSANSPTGTSYRVEAFGNGWYRVSVTMTLSATTCYAVVAISNSGTPTYDANGNPTFSAAGTETIHLWGGQLELGGFATSYIPNLVGGSTARGNEYADMTGADFSSWFTSAQGSFYIEAESYSPSYNSTAAFVFQGSGTDASGILVAMHDFEQVIWFNSSAGIAAGTDFGSTAASTYYKFCAAWANNDFAASRDGGAALTDTSGTYGNTATTLRLGMYRDNFYPLNGHVKSLKFWNSRIANADLVAISGGSPGGSAPTATAIGDVWFNPSEGNKEYRWSGSAWEPVQDAAIGTAQVTADGKNKTFPAGSSAPSGAIAGDLWPDTSSGTTVTRRFDGVSTWTLVSTVGAPSGTNVGSTAAATVEAGAVAANAGVNSDGTIKTNKVGTPAIVDGSITLPFIVRQSGTQVMGLTSGVAMAITGLSFTANIATTEVLDLEFVHVGVWSGTDGTRFSVDGAILRDGSNVVTFSTIFDTNDMATNNQGGFAFPISVSERITGNGASSTYSVTLTLLASTNESNSGGSKTYVAPLDFRVRGGILRGRRYNSK